MISAYNKDGFCTLDSSIPKEVCIQLGQELLKWKERTETESNQYGILAHNLHADLDAFWHVLHEYRLLEKAQEIYGSPLYFFQDNLIWKLPKTKSSISWHQDFSYWPLSKPKGITMWIALDACDLENGCMLLGAGSHRYGECAPNDFIANKPAQWAQDLPDLQVSEETILAHTLQQGQISVHHPLCAHTSGANMSDRHRRAWSITFVDKNLHWSPLHAPHPYNYWFQVQEGDSITNLPTQVSNWNKERYNTSQSSH